MQKIVYDQDNLNVSMYLKLQGCEVCDLFQVGLKFRCKSSSLKLQYCKPGNELSIGSNLGAQTEFVQGCLQTLFFCFDFQKVKVLSMERQD